MKLPFVKKRAENISEDEREDGTSVGSRLLGRLGELFTPEPQKEKVLRHEDFNAAGDTYYATVSVGYKIAQRIFIILLVFFLIFSLATNFREITYDNFFYLLKDFSAAVDAETSNYDMLSYGSDTRHFFALYKGGLTVVNPSSLSVFTATGRNTMQISSALSSPCIATSDKYFAVYDTAGTSFAVYNSFARIYSESFEYPVTDVCFSDDGRMTVVTKDISHKSLVHIYNKSFKRAFTVPSDKYVFDVAMSSENDMIAIAYYGIGIGNGETEVTVRSLSTMEETETVYISGEFLYKCGFLADGRFAAITDRAIHIYDKYFEELETYEYTNAAISGFDISSHGVAVSYVLNSKNIAIVFDKSGNLLYNEAINDNIKDIGIYGKYVFLRTDSGVIRFNAVNDARELLTSDQGTMLIYSDDTVLVCGDSKAEYLVFED